MPKARPWITDALFSDVVKGKVMPCAVKDCPASGAQVIFFN